MLAQLGRKVFHQSTQTDILTDFRPGLSSSVTWGATHSTAHLLYKMPSVTVLHSNHLIRQLMYRLSCRFLCFIWSVISLIETSQQIPTPLGPEWSCGCHDCPGDALRLSDEFLGGALIRQFWAPRMVRIYQLARVWGFPTMGEGCWWYHILFRNKSFFFFWGISGLHMQSPASIVSFSHGVRVGILP